jgi:NAD(P)-dependent dehydrogenase (short-subunit alcohol dehydrogenase family)
VSRHSADAWRLSRRDARNQDALRKAFEAGVGEIGPVDIVIANADVALLAVDEAHEVWKDSVDILLTDAVQHSRNGRAVDDRAQTRGGAIVLISSTAGLRGALGRPAPRWGTSPRWWS